MKNLFLFLLVFIAVLLGMAEMASAAGVIPEVDLIASYSSTGGTPQFKNNNQDLIYKIEQGANLTFSITPNPSYPNINYLWQVRQGSQVLAFSTGITTFNWTVPSSTSTWEIEIEATIKDEMGRTTGRESVSWSITTADLKIVNPGESIQTAIDSLPAVGGIIELGSGIHDINNTIYVNKSNVIIQGTHESELRHNDPNTDMFTVPQYFKYNDPVVPPKLSNITFKGFKITSTYAWADGDKAVIRTHNVDNLTMKGILSTARNFAVILINNEQDYRTTSENVAIKDNVIYYSSVLFMMSTNVTVKNNTFINYGRGFSINANRNNQYVYIFDNNITNPGGNGGIELYASEYQYAYANKISGGQRGISIQAGPQNVVVYNNTITGTTDGGIVIDPQFILKNITVRNNLIYNNNAPGILTRHYDFGLPDTKDFKTTVENNVIFNNSGDGIRETSEYVKLYVKNNIIVNNSGYGVNNISSNMSVYSYNDVWGNVNGSYNGTSAGVGDISFDPLFANVTAYDFHLKSQAGRWNGTAWVTDPVTSPAIDAGDPTSDYLNEPAPNGGRINMGAYGNAAEASKSGGVPPAPVFTSITLAPSSSSISAGSTKQFTAVPKDQFGNTMTGITISWTSSNTAIVTINSSGLATAVSQGTSTITASSGGISSAASLTVTLPPYLQSITVSPSAASISTGSTQQFTATPKDQFGNTMTGITITWNSSNTGLATINSSGLATALTNGATTITATSDSVSGSASITVANQPSGLVGYWKFDETTGTNAPDFRTPHF